MKIGQQAAQQFQLLLFPLGQVVVRHQLDPLHRRQRRPVEHHLGLQRTPAALPELPPSGSHDAVVVGHRAGETRLDALAEFRAVERRIPHRAPLLAGRERRQLAGELQFDDIRIAVGGVFVFGDGRWLRKRERDVVGRGFAEIPHNQLDQMPVRGVRLHEHADMRPDFVGCQSTIASDLQIGVDKGDHPEREQGPRCPRQPGSGPRARHLMPPIVDPFHGRTHPSAYITALKGVKIRWGTRWRTIIPPLGFATVQD